MRSAVRWTHPRAGVISQAEHDHVAHVVLEGARQRHLPCPAAAGAGAGASSPSIMVALLGEDVVRKAADELRTGISITRRKSSAEHLGP